MSNTITRKEFMGDAAKMTIGAVAGVTALSTVFSDNASANPSTVWPWPYAQLDIELVRKAGHDSYWSGKGCSYGAFHALVSALRVAVGDPYNSLPTEIMIYGHGGGAGWGGLCGALNGPCALISLVCTKERADIINNELLGWYTQATFPSDISNQYGIDSAYGDNRYTQALPQNVSGSILCHVSVTEWCNATSIAVGDLKRKERCARITGDVAAYAAKLLNDEFQSQFASTYTSPQSVAVCGTCHGSTGSQPYTAVKMECVQCHGNMHNSIPTPVAASAMLIPTFKLEQNYPNPFNPHTKIHFTLPKNATVSLGIYDLNGRIVKHLISGEQRGSGTHSIAWDGTNDNGEKISSGVYFSRLQAGEYVASTKMNLIK